MNTIASRLTWIRTQRNMSYEEFAGTVKEKAGYAVAQPTVIGYLKGTTGKIPGEFLVAVASAFDVAPGWLLAGEGAPNPVGDTVEGLWFQLALGLADTPTHILEDRLTTALYLLQKEDLEDDNTFLVEPDEGDEWRVIALPELITKLESVVGIWETWRGEVDRPEDAPLATISPVVMMNTIELLQFLQDLNIPLPERSVDDDPTEPSGISEQAHDDAVDSLVEGEGTDELVDTDTDDTG